jgi:hypothetical protein
MGNILVYGVCLLLLAAIICIADFRFPILRDPSSPTSAVTGGGRSYSLARVQMAVWTVIVIGSLLFLLFTGHVDLSGALKADALIDSHLVLLIGISGATGLVAAGVDANKDSQVQTAKDTLGAVTSSLASADLQEARFRITAAADPANTVATQTALRLSAIRGDKLQDMKDNRTIIRSQRRDAKSDGFIKDLLTDENGNSLHRLQLVGFTLIFGAIVIIRIFNGHGQGPDMSNVGLSLQDLGLLGLSGGVYFGFKVPGRSA